MDIYDDDGARAPENTLVAANKGRVPDASKRPKEPVEVADVKQYVEVLNKLIRR